MWLNNQGAQRCKAEKAPQTLLILLKCNFLLWNQCEKLKSLLLHSEARCISILCKLTFSDFNNHKHSCSQIPKCELIKAWTWDTAQAEANLQLGQKLMYLKFWSVLSYFIHHFPFTNNWLLEFNKDFLPTWKLDKY